MRMTIGALALLAPLAAGCETLDGAPPPTDAERYTCNAARAQALVGQTATQAVGAEAVRATGARTLRWITPGGAYTMDYRTDRLNIHLDAQNKVTRVECG